MSGDPGPLRLSAHAATRAARPDRPPSVAVGKDERAGLFVLAAGSGGAPGASAVVARAVLETVSAFVAEHGAKPLALVPGRPEGARSRHEALLAGALLAASRRIELAAARDRRLDGAAASAVAALETGSGFAVAASGPSAAFVWSADRGLRSALPAGDGEGAFASPRFATTPAGPGDVLVLASPGLGRAVDSRTLAQVVEAHDDALDRAVDLLLRHAANRAPAEDAAVLLVRVSPEAAAARPTTLLDTEALKPPPTAGYHQALRPASSPPTARRDLPPTEALDALRPSPAPPPTSSPASSPRPPVSRRDLPPTEAVEALRPSPAPASRPPVSRRDLPPTEAVEALRPSPAPASRPPVSRRDLPPTELVPALDPRGPSKR